ncbi:hypothetical protein PVK06_006436 [Gossypium arboreum]|uniref:Uncharacterized protein n=1 Tax=Gossypium arboreum TaxID=29729 RepID=A0ABR0QF83_GOSAR|nr:hypothetical protein PVK06_006436 [Gossypium arboreum]
MVETLKSIVSARDIIHDQRWKLRRVWQLARPRTTSAARQVYDLWKNRNFNRNKVHRATRNAGGGKWD